MKPTTTPKDSAPRSAVVPATSASDLEAQFTSLLAEERSIQERKAQLRQTYWDNTLATLRGQIDNLLSHGFDRPQIAKALGFTLSGTKPSSPKGTGPTTYDGWLALFRNIGIRAYLKAHPDLAATLRTQKVAPADYSAHVPAADLKAIETGAATKAQAKSPRPTTQETQK